MARPKSSQPTERELAILRVLWGRGPSTVREVHESLGDTQQVGYTSVLKILQIMTDKGLVVRDEAGRRHVYRAAQAKEATQTQIVQDIVERVFGGSALGLVSRALSAKPASREERAQIRELLERMEGEEDGP